MKGHQQTLPGIRRHNAPEQVRTPRPKLPEQPTKVPEPVEGPRSLSLSKGQERTTRVMAVWCPDWPVIAAMEAENLPPHAAVAVVAKGEVFACSSTARTEGVRRGMRKRDAAARCPELIIIDHNPDLDSRAFEPVLSAIEEFSPGVEVIRPGLCALTVPSRYYGGEAEAAALLAEKLVSAGIWDLRIGIADELFTAEQAARLAVVQDHQIIETGRSAAFLAGLPIGVLAEDNLVGLLLRMGINTLGDFVRLPAKDVLTRFGHAGARAHRLAGARTGRKLSGRSVPPEHQQQVSFAPGLETIEPIAFSSRQTADRFVAGLARNGLVCTAIRIEVDTENGWHHERRWAHPRWFDSSDIIDRLRWQLQADPAPDPVVQIRLLPDQCESVGTQSEGLWGSAPDEKIQRGIARVQGMIGFDGVLAAGIQGGREPADRELLTPWGEQPTSVRPTGLPWPGSLPPPAPTRVFEQPLPAVVLDLEGQPIKLTDRGGISGEPGRFRPTKDGDFVPVEAWVGPWPIDERWWEEPDSPLRARFQIVAPDGSAWLLVATGSSWFTEARYD
ncbi:DNA polymerase Y family protein [Microlunatus soli]|uniref:DNA polymerase Y family protein n=1 Tax=Microlunatus soli TaxID=630515 RepID=UPI001E309D5D|nr:DNA polymerase Y family protein [Microlunatus soli]